MELIHFSVCELNFQPPRCEASAWGEGDTKDHFHSNNRPGGGGAGRCSVIAMTPHVTYRETDAADVRREAEAEGGGVMVSSR